MVLGLCALMSVGMLWSMEEGQKTVFSSEYLCSILNDLAAAEKNNTHIDSLGRTVSEFVQTILSSDSDGLLQTNVDDSSIEKALVGLSEQSKKLLAQEFLSSSSFPFADKKTFYIGKKTIDTIPKASCGAPVCFKSANGTPVFRIKENSAVYGLYEGLAKKQTLTFSQEPTKIAWDASGVVCAYACTDGCYFQPLEKGQGFIKRLLCDSAESLTALALHPRSKVALLGLTEGTKFIFSNDSDVLLSEHTAPISTAKFSQNGSFAATGDEKGIVCLWSVEGALKQRFLSKETRSVTALGFDNSEDSLLMRLIVGYASGSARIWNMHSNKILAECSHHTGAVTQADLVGPVGITLGSEGIIALWAAATGTVLRLLDCDPLRTSFIVARSVDNSERETGDELTIISVFESMNGTGRVICDRYDFDMFKQHALLVSKSHDPAAIIRAAALARVAKKYGGKVVRAESAAKSEKVSL